MAIVLDQYSEQVQALYIAYFGRAGEPDGFEYWVGKLASGQMTFAQAAASFAQQTEALLQHNFLLSPQSSSPSAFVDSLYRQLLNREPDVAGHAYWMDQLAKAAGNPALIGVLIAQFISGANDANGDAAIIQNKIDAGIYFANELRSEGIGGTYNGSLLDQKYLPLARDVVDNEVTSSPSSVAISRTEVDNFLTSSLAVVSATGLPISVLEGNTYDGSTITIRIERTGDLSQGATVDYRMSGHGQNPATASDVLAGFHSGTVSFEPNQSSYTFYWLPNGDTDIEPDEQFVVTIFSAVGAVIADATEVVTIRNDDPLPPQRLLVQIEPAPPEYLG